MAGVTIRDVARLAQVSVASVSRALNGLANVHPDTRERVVSAANELGYIPHAGARSLSLARAQTIGVVLPDIHGEFFSEIVRGMDRQAGSHGYLLLLSTMHAGNGQAGSALRAMRGRVDGLIIMAPHVAPEAVEDALPPEVPALLINSPAGKRALPRLRLDNFAGAQAVVRHLLEGNRRRLLHIAGPDGNIDAAERAEAFRRAVAGSGAEWRILPGDFTEEAGEGGARAILSGEVACDAVFAANDMMALGCLHALRAGGVAVPDEVAVAGFDDVPLARYLALTTVRVRIAELGARAIDRLIGQLGADRSDQDDELHLPELVIRATTAPRADIPVPPIPSTA